MKSRYFPYVVLLALLPIMLLRDFTPDNELRYLSIADEALRSGSIFTFTNHGIPYADKPPLYFWIIMFGKWLLGNHYMWLLSIFSIIPAIVIIQIMDKWVALRLNDTNRFIAKLMLMSSAFFLALSVTLRMDMLMCMFIVLSLHTFYRLYIGTNTKWDVFLFPFYIFMAIFTKGPIGFIVPFLSTIVFLIYKKKAKLIGHFWGYKTWGILFALCLIWFIGVYLEGGKDYLNNLLFHQTLDRAVNAFHHKKPFYYYFISFWYSLAPWSILIVVAIVNSIKSRKFNSDLEDFFLTIILVTFITLSLISSKLEIYLAPAFPFFIYLTILFLQKQEWNRCIKFSIGFPSLLFAFLLPVIIYLTQYNHTFSYLNHPLILISTGILSISSILGIYLLYKRKNIAQAIMAISLGMFISIFIAGWSLPKINAQFGYADLCKAAKHIGEQKHISKYCILSLGRPENMDVFLGNNFKVVTPSEIINNNYNNTIILTESNIELKRGNELLRTYFEGKEKYTIGKYSIIIQTNQSPMK